MNIGSIFQTNDPVLETIWETGTKIFSEIETDHLDTFTTHTLDLQVYVELALLLTAEVNIVESLLYKMAEYLENGQCTLAILGYPHAVLSFATYVDDVTRVIPLYDHAKRLIELLDGAEAEQTMCAHRLGAKLALQKLAYMCGAPLNRAELGFEVSAFHKMAYKSSQGLYTPFEVNYLAAAYGFTSDDGEDTIREHLMEHSFDVEKCERYYLYQALYHLEAYDALLSSILEAGAIHEQSSPAALAGLLAMLTMVCGIDVPMLAKGIRAMQPQMPDHMAFRAVLTSPEGPICFDFGELMFNEEYF